MPNNVQQPHARTLLEKAIDLEPRFSLAYPHLSRNRAVCSLNRWEDSPEDLLRSAFELGCKAIEIDEFNSHAHFAVGAAAL